MSKRKSGVVDYRNYYLPYDFPVLLLSGDHWRISSKRSNSLHFHNCLEIGICHSDSGYMDFSGNSEPIKFKAGDITCIPQNIPHTTWSSPGTESHWSYIFINPDEFMRSVFPKLNPKAYDLSLSSYKDYKYLISSEEHPEVYTLVMAIIKELEEKKVHYHTNASGLLVSLIVQLYRIQSAGGELRASLDNPPENAMVLSPVLDYIEQNYFQSIEIDYLADICRLSPTHFRRLFHSVMGTNPLDFINTTRINKACNLLRSTEDSILDISEAVGFRSVSTFNRHFTTIMKTTPRDYRAETLQLKENTDKASIREYKGWMFPEK